MNWLLDAHQWAKRVFGGSNLGDPRRTRRLVDCAARQAQAGNTSPMAACRDDAAAAEGAYRLIRNQKSELQRNAAFATNDGHAPTKRKKASNGKGLLNI